MCNAITAFVPSTWVSHWISFHSRPAPHHPPEVRNNNNNNILPYRNWGTSRIFPMSFVADLTLIYSVCTIGTYIDVYVLSFSTLPSKIVSIEFILRAFYVDSDYRPIRNADDEKRVFFVKFVGIYIFIFFIRCYEIFLVKRIAKYAL